MSSYLVVTKHQCSIIHLIHHIVYFPLFSSSLFICLLISVQTIRLCHEKQSSSLSLSLRQGDRLLLLLLLLLCPLQLKTVDPRHTNKYAIALEAQETSEQASKSFHRLCLFTVFPTWAGTFWGLRGKGCWERGWSDPSRRCRSCQEWWA